MANQPLPRQTGTATEAKVAEVEVPEVTQPSTLRQLRFDEVKALQKQGWSQRAVGQHLDLDRRMVGKYFALDNCPERPSVSQSTSTVTPYLAYLSKRWQAGCQNIKELHTELQGQGFTGHYASVYRAVKQLVAGGQLMLAVTTHCLSLFLTYLSLRRPGC